jgi:hypothetical protein
MLDEAVGQIDHAPSRPTLGKKGTPKKSTPTKSTPTNVSSNLFPLLSNFAHLMESTLKPRARLPLRLYQLNMQLTSLLLF